MADKHTEQLTQQAAAAEIITPYISSTFSSRPPHPNFNASNCTLHLIVEYAHDAEIKHTYHAIMWCTHLQICTPFAQTQSGAWCEKTTGASASTSSSIARSRSVDFWFPCVVVAVGVGVGLL